MQFGPMRCEGIGLSDGETMEHLWSYLRRFGRMTKEMRPAHRIDVLAHALVHYGMKTKAKLGVYMCIHHYRFNSLYTSFRKPVVAKMEENTANPRHCSRDI